MKEYVVRFFIYIASAVILVAIGIVIGININISKIKPSPVHPGYHSWTFPESYEGHVIDDNFWNFVHASYVLVGTPPECEFYKIVSEVPRHSYNPENFYIEDNDNAMYYHLDDGTRASSVAIDVSTYQTYVDWDKVRAAGVDVVMIRVGFRGYGSGKIVLDNMFEDHAEKAKAAGLRVGVYFFSQALNYEEGVEEAEFALDAIKDYGIDGPVAIDTEYVDAADARTVGLGISARTDGVVGFCEKVKAAGYEPMIYASRNWFVQCLDMTRLGDYRLWLAHYTNQSDFPYEYMGWQYTDSGEIDGISGKIDMNVWFE